MSAEQLRQFMKQGLGIRQVVQAVEDALIDAGYDDHMVWSRSAVRSTG